MGIRSGLHRQVETEKPVLRAIPRRTTRMRWPEPAVVAVGATIWIGLIWLAYELWTK
jgi:hypothetical protein